MLQIIKDIFSIKDIEKEVRKKIIFFEEQSMYTVSGDKKVLTMLKTIDEYQRKAYWKEAKLLAESLVELLDEKSKEKPKTYPPPPPPPPKGRTLKGDTI